MTGTGKDRYGNTTHRCRKCGRRFLGTGLRGRPHKLCPSCEEEKTKGEAGQ